MKGNVYYVPGVGIDVSQYIISEGVREKKRTELNIPSDAFVLISVGELNANKNNTIILSALKKLKNKKIHYVLCGKGDKLSLLKKQVCDADLQNNVHFLGYRSDVKELYAMSDCFVIPSFREGLSRSIMEAMASGLPCVVSDIRGNVDLIEDGVGGFLCAAKDSVSFAEKINLLAENETLCMEMGKNNLEIIKKFSVEKVTEKIRKIYSTEFVN